MDLKYKIYEPLVTVYDKDNKHTACEGERCKLDSIFILEKKAFFIVFNCIGNQLNIPPEIFKDVFQPSKDQTSPL